ncbi:MAG: zinc-binding dehydrogenase [Bacteroidales bacterium]|nr:zinc-binding dehydrogenase [Bacteroidales bacterium]
MELPVKSKSVILSSYNDNLVRAIVGIKLGETTIELLNPDEVLIKMEAAPCNPSDIAFIRGGYNIQKSLPAVPGFEGAGIIVEAGQDVKDRIGDIVSCFTQHENSGTWSQYFIARARDCISLKSGMEIDQAACLSINPLTAYGLLELAVKKNAKAIVLNAAGGQVPSFIRILAAKKGLRVINIVRKQEHVDALKEKGARDILCSASENFESEFKGLANKRKASVAFDAVGGEQTGLLLNNMPDGSEVVVYGGLSGQDCTGIDPLGIIFKGKTLSGFNLGDWTDGKRKDEFLKITDELQDMIIKGEIQTEIQASFKLRRVVEGIKSYIKSMSSGKVLFKP